MKKNTDFRNFSISLFLILFSIALILMYFNIEYQSKQVVSSQTIEEKIESLSELTIVKYNYKDVLSYKSTKQINGLNIPFTKKSFLIVYSGYIKAGVDLKNIDIAVDSENNITLNIKNAQFQDNVINEDEVIIHDESSSLFNKLNYDDLFKSLEKEKKKIESKLTKSGFLQDANNRTALLLKSLLTEMGFNNITIDFKK